MNLNKIRELAHKQQINLSVLADKVGMTRTGLYTSITKNALKAETLEKMAEILQVPIWVFFDLDPETVLESKIKVLIAEIAELESKYDELNKTYKHTIDRVFEQERFIKTLEHTIEAQNKLISSQEEIKTLISAFESVKKNAKKTGEPKS